MSTDDIQGAPRNMTVERRLKVIFAALICLPTCIFFNKNHKVPHVLAFLH